MRAAYPEILKQDGTTEPFRPEKLENSLLRAGAPRELAGNIVGHVSAEVKKGDTTTKIYRHAFELLKSEHAPVPAARYSMKRAIQELGPSGFPFEEFVAEIFKARGYSTKTGIMLKGACATHEVDMVAEKDGKKIAAEMKFHNNLGITSDLKVALYVQARFLDLKEHAIDEMWLITNTRFTGNALAYGRCTNMQMISWGGPEKGNLQDLIEEAGVQPVTALPSLSSQEKRQLLDAGVVLCRTLNTEPSSIHGLFSEEKLKNMVSESKALCGGGKEV